MEDEPQKKQNGFSIIYKIINAPLVILLLGALIAGKIVIQVTGFQLSIGITLLVILCIFIAMAGSFFLGMQYPFAALFSMLSKQKMPLHFRIISAVFSVLMFPWLWREKQREKNYKASNSSFNTTNRKLSEIFQNMSEKGQKQSTDNN